MGYRDFRRRMDGARLQCLALIQIASKNAAKGDQKRCEQPDNHGGCWQGEEEQH